MKRALPDEGAHYRLIQEHLRMSSAPSSPLCGRFDLEKRICTGRSRDKTDRRNMPLCSLRWCLSSKYHSADNPIAIGQALCTLSTATNDKQVQVTVSTLHRRNNNITRLDVRSSPKLKFNIKHVRHNTIN